MATLAETQKTLDEVIKTVTGLERQIGQIKNDTLEAVRLFGDSNSKADAEFDSRIVALGERVVKLEAAAVANGNGEVTLDEFRGIIGIINDLHIRVMGVPAGQLQSLHDKPASD